MTPPTTEKATNRMIHMLDARGLLRQTLAAMLPALVISLAVASSAAAFGVAEFSGQRLGPDGNQLTQAGAHPDYVTTLKFPVHTDENGAPAVEGNVRDVLVDLPPGMVGNPAGIPQCTEQDLGGPEGIYPVCSASSQVGEVVADGLFGGTMTPLPFPMYNLVPPEGMPARFGFNMFGVRILIDAKLRKDGRYSIAADSTSISQTIALGGIEATFWGVPADPSHDTLRTGIECRFVPTCPSDAPRRPFITNATNCEDGARTTRVRTRSWEEPDVWHTASFDEDALGNPWAVDGCDELRFDPELSVEPTSHAPDSPTGLDFELRVPQSDSADELATAHLRDVSVTLPEGMTVSPSSAGGLGACSPAQIDLDTVEVPTCPESSKIGTVTLDTPLIEEDLPGSVYLAKQSDNPFGSLLAMYVAVVDESRGIVVKLPGRVSPDPATGRLTVTFDDNPELPFSSLRMNLNSGPRAPLATPPTCGTKTVTADLTSWAGHAKSVSDSFEIDCPGMAGFAPSFSAGAVSPTGGAFSPFVVRIDRQDGEQYLDGVTIDMPKGMLAKLRGVPLCADSEMAAGSCGAGSRVGSATVGAGPGSSPFLLSNQPVYLGGPYKGAPYSLSVAARVIAGPLDLGTVVVRQAIHVDPDDASLTIASDPFPRIVEGVPLRLRSIDVAVDRPGFALNPTSCSEQQVGATLTAFDGSVHRTSSRFQVGDCKSLAFKPRLGLRLVGKGRMRSGGHPTLRATVTQAEGQSNIEHAKVTLPRNLVLDSKNAYDPKLVCDYDAAQKADCPASTIIGRASLSTPILNRKLAGPVHLVQGIRFGSGGARIRTLPTLLVKLRGEVAIDLRSNTTVDKSSRLVSTFPNVPDAAVSKFSLQVDGGRKGILVVTENRRGRIDLCSAKQTALVETDGHNGKRADYPVRVKTPCKVARKKGRPAS